MDPASRNGAIVFLATFAFAGAVSGLELDYKPMPVLDGKVPVYTNDNLLFMADINAYATDNWITDNDMLIAAVYAELVRQYPDLELVRFGPLFYGHEGDAFSYIFQFKPKTCSG